MSGLTRGYNAYCTFVDFSCFRNVLRDTARHTFFNGDARGIRDTCRRSAVGISPDLTRSSLGEKSMPWTTSAKLIAPAF